MTAFPAYRLVAGESEPSAAQGGQAASAIDVGLRYRIARGATILAIDGGVLCEGGPERRVIRGAAAGLVAPVAALLDGVRDLEAIAHEAEMPVGHVGQIVEALDEAGLIEIVDREPGPLTAPVPEHVRTFLGRSIGMSRDAPNAEAACERLAGAAIALEGDASYAAAIAELLAAAGVAACDHPPAEAHLTVHCSVAEDPAAAQRLEALGDVATGAILRLSAGPDWLELGPLFDRDYRPCAACLVTATAGEGSRVSGGEQLRETIAPLAASTIVRLAAGLDQDLRRLGAYVRFDLAAWSAEHRFYASLGSCGCCGGSRALSGGGLPHRYEQLVQDAPARRLSNAAVRDAATRPRPRRRVKHLPTAPRIPLPPPSLVPIARSVWPDWRTSPDAVGDVTATHVAAILLGASRVAADYAVSDLLEGAPMPALGYEPQAACLYTVTSGVHDLPDHRVLYYEPAEHSLVDAFDETVDADRLRDALAIAPGDWPLVRAVIVVVAALPTLQETYGDAALKVGLIGAGGACAGIRAAALDYGMRAVALDGWDDAWLAGRLELHEHLEPLGQVMALVA